jgi:hypothetical protein
MSDIFGVIKDLALSRGVQLATRFGGVYLAALAGKIGVTFSADQLASLSSGLSLLLISGLLFGIDILIHHPAQKVAAVEAAIEAGK